tara:strand:- start:1069 stop:1302 length:234 start_codon:yes stop_codon:yes gene_type:complete
MIAEIIYKKLKHTNKMTKSEIELQTHNYDQRIRALVTSMSKLKDDLDYATEHLILDIMRVEYESKITELNTENEVIK